MCLNGRATGSESSAAVVHNTIVVVTDAQGIDLFFNFKLPFGTGHHVVHQKVDVLVAIRTTLFVPETDGMAQFVESRGKPRARVAERYALLKVLGLTTDI